MSVDPPVGSTTTSDVRVNVRRADFYDQKSSLTCCLEAALEYWCARIAARASPRVAADSCSTALRALSAWMAYCSMQRL